MKKMQKFKTKYFIKKVLGKIKRALFGTKKKKEINIWWQYMRKADYHMKK